jgi:hypothetical protein
VRNANDNDTTTTCGRMNTSLRSLLYASLVQRPLACSFRWFIMAESTVRWFVVREKHCWMAADSADKLKRTRRLSARSVCVPRCSLHRFLPVLPCPSANPTTPRRHRSPTAPRTHHAVSHPLRPPRAISSAPHSPPSPVCLACLHRAASSPWLARSPRLPPPS